MRYQLMRMFEAGPDEEVLLEELQQVVPEQPDRHPCKQQVSGGKQRSDRMGKHVPDGCKFLVQHCSAQSHLRFWIANPTK